MIRLVSLLVAIFLLIPGSQSFALMVTPLTDQLVSVMTTTSAPSRDEAIVEARQEAVLASVGRVLIDDQLLKADELLEKYLQNYSENFVVGVEVLDDQFQGGETVLKSRVFVNYEALVKDMEEKRFLFKPAYKPQALVFLEQHLDGQRINQPARTILQSSLQAAGMKIFEGVVPEPGMDQTLLDDDVTFNKAIKTSERKNVEVIFTGVSKTTLREERKFYYDAFYLYDCDLDISMIRVDTGEVLHRTSATGAASARNRAEAITKAIDRASQTLSTEFVEVYEAIWPRLVQSDADFELLLTGTDEELNNILMQFLEQSSDGLMINLKKTFNSSAVITVSYPVELESDLAKEKARTELMHLLESCPYPAMNIIREVSDKKLEVQVSG